MAEPKFLKNPIRLLPGNLDGTCEDGRARVAALIQAAAVAFPDWRPPPFDPGVYARLLGVPVTYSPELKDWDALLVPRGGRYRIVCRADVSLGRQRFSVAHEISHLFFERNSDTDLFMRARDRERYYRTPEARELERACDALAAELLMPRPWFDEAVARHGLRAATIPDLAREFEVSLEATALRLVELAPEPCAVGFFEYAPRPGARRPGNESFDPEGVRYRARRVFRSKGFPFLFPEGKSVPRDSVIYRCSLQLEELENVEDFGLGSRRERLRVQAFPLHRSRAVVEPPTVCAVLLA